MMLISFFTSSWKKNNKWTKKKKEQISSLNSNIFEYNNFKPNIAAIPQVSHEQMA